MFDEYVCKCLSIPKSKRPFRHKVKVKSVTSFEYATALLVQIGEENQQLEILRDEVIEFANFLRNAGEQFDGNEVEFSGRIIGKISIRTKCFPNWNGGPDTYLCRLLVHNQLGGDQFEFEPNDLCLLSDEVINVAKKSFKAL